ncbi:uncharacterized protein N0V89_007953 [Didymosphaeria variabile]|uniref:F-box domain-containing protein n=1 Tax=Didymosphaeria variabile TaxID=1932322 RepID=A0A9W9C847_9PLEO|nr:uncharacterized protein N0V89_007953 [Didymosphaeria variabile]KAJ4349339.1 hypothetical protein N0V89_007953 [Didymosphaeria variabile]
MAPMFNIMALPLDLILEFLAHAMRVRGAIRHRLGNRHLDVQIMKILRQSPFLEGLAVQLYKLGELGTEFMIWRLLHVLPVNPLWDEFRRLARTLADYGGNSEWSFEANISLLSRKANRGMHLMIKRLCDPHTELGSLGPPGLLDIDALRFEHDLVRTAIHSGDLSIVEILSTSAALQDLWREDGDALCELCVAGVQANDFFALEIILA